MKTPKKKSKPSIAPVRGRPKNAGVWERQNGSYLAVVYRGEAQVFAGTWGTWKEAAVARDRAVLYLGFSDQQLNFPGLSKRKGPASPDALTRDAHGRRKSQRAAPTKFRGVTSVGTRGARWQASIKLRGREALFLGRWATTRLAAEARLAGDFTYCLAQQITEAPVPIGVAFDAALQCLSHLENDFYGPRAFTYTLLGDRATTICAQPKDAPCASYQ